MPGLKWINIKNFWNAVLNKFYTLWFLWFAKFCTLLNTLIFSVLLSFNVMGCRNSSYLIVKSQVGKATNVNFKQAAFSGWGGEDLDIKFLFFPVIVLFKDLWNDKSLDGALHKIFWGNVPNPHFERLGIILKPNKKYSFYCNKE